MHISFMVPMWALIGFGTVAYPSLGALVASFLMRASNRRLHGALVGLAGVAWPLTLALGVVAFPLWLAGWLMKNYGQAIAQLLRGREKGVSETASSFSLRDDVILTKGFGSVGTEAAGMVADQRGSELLVDFPGLGRHWVPSSIVRRS